MLSGNNSKQRVPNDFVCRHAANLTDYFRRACYCGRFAYGVFDGIKD